MPFRFNPFTDKLDLIDITSIPPGTVVTLTGNTGGAVGPDGSGNINVLGAGQISVAGNPGTNTLTISLGAGIATTYTANTGSATPALNNLNLLATVAAAGTTPFTSTGAGSTITYTVQRTQAAALSAANIAGLASFSSDHFAVDANGFVTLAGGGQAVDSFAMQTGTSPVVPTAAGLVTFNGAVVANGTNPVRTDGTGANTMALEVQISAAIAATDATKIGLAAFDSANFTVDANGFVSLSGSGFLNKIGVDAATAPGTNPVVPSASSQINITGAQVAAGTTTNVIRTNSLAANTFTIQIQRSQAVASSTIGDNGVSHFDSARFTVDANGFVSLNGAGVGETITGDTGGALSPTAGNWNILGSSPAAGSNPVRTTGTGSTLTINVQKSQAIASTNASNVGLAAFNSAHFSVDANGFVSSLGAGFAWIDQSTNTTLVANTGYFATAAVTLTLPASPSQGDVIKLICDTTSSVVLTANTGQTIRQGTIVSSSAGTFTNSQRGDALELVYRAATTQWIALNGNGVWVGA